MPGNQPVTGAAREGRRSRAGGGVSRVTALAITLVGAGVAVLVTLTVTTPPAAPRSDHRAARLAAPAHPGTATQHADSTRAVRTSRGKATPTVSQPLPAPLSRGLPRAGAAEVTVSRLGIESSLIRLGLDPDGTLQVPTNFAVAGWYSAGAYPGQPDEPPAIVVGHVDSTSGPAVFYRLPRSRVGDIVRIRRTDGSVAEFVVYRTARYPKATFDAHAVYAPSKRPELRLITCSGRFDRAARSYLSNFVAYAYLVHSIARPTDG